MLKWEKIGVSNLAGEIALVEYKVEHKRWNKIFIFSNNLERTSCQTYWFNNYTLSE